MRIIERHRASVNEDGTLDRAYTLIECDCGEPLLCRSFTNTCECGRDYNGAGQRLAPREQWGEETGEHWTEVI